MPCGILKARTSDSQNLPSRISSGERNFFRSTPKKITNIALKQKTGNTSQIQLRHYGQSRGQEEQRVIETMAWPSAYRGCSACRVSGMDTTLAQFSREDGLRVDVRDP